MQQTEPVPTAGPREAGGRSRSAREPDEPASLAAGSRRAAEPAPGQRGLRWALVLTGLWLVIEYQGYAAGRRYYDDELFSLYAARLSYAEIPRFVAANDTHPPGAYMFLRAMFQLFGESEQAAFAGSLVLTASSVSMAVLAYCRIVGGNPLLFAVPLMPNSSLLIHGSAARWYPLWTCIAWLGFHVLTARPGVGWPGVLAAGMLFGASLYVNYLGLLLVAAMTVWLFSRGMALKALVGCLVAITLFIPWVPPFLEHVGAMGLQILPVSRPVSLGYVGFVMFAGETLSPFRVWVWALVLAGPGTLFLLQLRSNWRDQRLRLGLLLLAAMVAYCVATGFWRARSFLFFSMVVALLIAPPVRLDRFRGLAHWSYAIYLLLAALGFINAVKGIGYHKRGLTDPVGDVLAQLEVNGADGPLVVLTVNPVVAHYAASDGRPPGQRVVINPYRDKEAADSGREPDRLPGGLPVRFAVIDSFLGYLSHKQADWEAWQHHLGERFSPDAEIVLGTDPEAAAKRRFFPSQPVPEYRFKIRLYTIAEEAEREALAELVQAYRDLWWR